MSQQKKENFTPVYKESIAGFSSAILPSFSNYKESIVLKAEAIISAAKSDKKSIDIYIESKKEAKQVGRAIAKHVAAISDSSKKNEIISNVNVIMKSIARKTNLKYTRSEQLDIVADEYIKAAKEGNFVHAVIKKDRSIVLKPDKSKYKGAVNFNMFTSFEIQNAVKSKIETNSNEYWIIIEGLRARDLINNEKIAIKANQFSRLYNGRERI